MVRTWSMLGWNALILSVLTAVPALAVEPADRSAETAKTEQLLKKIDDLTKSLGEMRKDFKSSVDAMREEQKDLTMRSFKTLDDFEELRKQVSQLRQELDTLRRSGSSSPRTSFSYSPELTNPLNPLVLGRIRLVNTFPDAMTIVVNQTAYRLLPGETRVLEGQRAGQFTYQVLGVQPEPQNRALTSGETMTINVYPR